MVLALWIKFASSCICMSHFSFARGRKLYQIMADWKNWYFPRCFVATAEGNLEKNFFVPCMILTDGNGHWNGQMNNFCPRYLMTPRVCSKYCPPKTELTGKARQGKAHCQIVCFASDVAGTFICAHSNHTYRRLLHLVGFIIRIYHDARSPESETRCKPWWNQDEISIGPPWVNVNYSWRTAPLTSKVAFYIFIQPI